ncbi:hypothetical protein UABAM_02786 [Candidatus Uabimicrobium amorphum]|uniref:Uncharacterized protein n=2 Tax=Uabimicrobium amorphum TaxID=2596890 RepID=A0A5S9F392_UABAM|nr:hypothetical protein UABAM_02786 [Candidatus Uabimicrobium amorphum]
MTFAQYVSAQIKDKTKKHKAWMKEQIAERQKVINQLRSVRKKGNTQKAREREAQLEAFKKSFNSAFYKDIAPGGKLYWQIEEDYLSFLARAKIQGKKINKKILNSLGDAKKDFDFLTNKIAAEIKKSRASNLKLVGLKTKKVKLQNFDIVLAPKVDKRFIYKIRRAVVDYSLIWILYYKGTFYRLEKETANYITMDKEWIKRYRFEHKIEMLKEQIFDDKIVAKLSPSKYRFAEFEQMMHNIKKVTKTDLPSDSLWDIHRSIFKECRKNKQVFYDYPDLYLFSSKRDADYTKMAKIAKSNKDYPYWSKQPVKGNMYLFPEVNKLCYTISADRDPYSKSYKVTLERRKEYERINAGKKYKAWGVERRYWIIGNVSISDRKKALAVIKTVVKYYIKHDENGVPIFDLEPLRTELAKLLKHI